MSLFGRRKPVPQETTDRNWNLWWGWLRDHEVDEKDPVALRAALADFIVAHRLTRAEADAMFAD